MKKIRTKFKDVFLIENASYSDNRGKFYEFYKSNFIYGSSSSKFVQDNYSFSKKNVIRGLHFRDFDPQSQLVTVIDGEIFDIVVNINKKSKYYKEYLSITLNSNKVNQLFMPPGYAHGFCVLTKTATLLYKVDKYYNPKYEKGIVWNDSDVGIKWPINKPIVSKRDKLFPKLNEIADDIKF